MPAYNFDLRNPAAISTIDVAGLTVPAAVGDRGGARIRRVGADPERWARDGQLFASAVLTTEIVAMSGLTEVFGVTIDAAWQRTHADAESACALQVTLDGETYLAWTGADWEEQDETGVFNTRAEFCDHCAALVLANPRRLGFRVRMESANNDTPEVRGVVAAVEWRYDYLVDAIQALHTGLSAAQFPFVTQVEIAAATTRLTVPTQMTIVTSNAHVFNLTTDPLRNTDIAAGFDGSVIVLADEQPAGSVLEVSAWATMRVCVARQDEMLVINTVPVCNLRVGSVREVACNVGVMQDSKRGDVSRRVRRRDQGPVRLVPLDVEVVVAEPRTAWTAIEVLRQALSRATVSPATGVAFTLLEDAPASEVPSYADGVEVARWRGSLLVPTFVQTYEEFEGVREVGFGVGSLTRVWENRTLR